VKANVPVVPTVALRTMSVPRLVLTKVQVTVSSDLLAGLPKGRSFQSVIPFAAGARQEPLQGGANGYQIDGASNGENVYLIDGVNTTNIQNGGVGKSFQMDFVEEVQVKCSSFEAEYGGALGGVINAVGKRGSNNWHGSLVTYLQTNALNANNGDRALRLNPATATGEHGDQAAITITRLEWAGRGWRTTGDALLVRTAERLRRTRPANRKTPGRCRTGRRCS
jgi:hypothetical protein